MLRIIVFLFVFGCFYTDGMQFSVFKVGQGNFTVFKNVPLALVVDCGYGSGEQKQNWVTGYEEDERFVYSKISLIERVFDGVERATIAISHDHEDHKKLYKALVNFLNEKGVEVNTITVIEWYFPNESAIKACNDFAGALGNVEIVPLLSNIQKGAHRTTPHDACLVLMVKAGEHVFLLPGDANGRVLRNLVHKNGNPVNHEFFQMVTVFLFSHHGSLAKDAIQWFLAVHGGGMVRFRDDSFDMLTITDKGIRETSEFSSLMENNETTLIQHFQRRLPLLSIVSSCSLGADRIPLSNFINYVLSRYPYAGGYVANHSVTCYHASSDARVYLPAFNSHTGCIVPVFSTEDADAYGDGVFRIIVGADNMLRMYAFPLPSDEEFPYPKSLFAFHDTMDFSEQNNIQIRFFYESLKSMLADALSGLRKIKENNTIENMYEIQNIFLHSFDVGSFDKVITARKLFINDFHLEEKFLCDYRSTVIALNALNRFYELSLPEIQE